MNRCEILALVDAVSLLLAEGLSDEDLDMLGNVLSTIGSFISTFSTIVCDETEESVEIETDEAVEK